MTLFCQNDLIAEVARRLFERSIPEGVALPRRFLLACSGGLDSMVLLDLMSEWARERTSLKLEILHVNYGLRAEESDEDARFVKAAAEARGWPCHILKVPTEERPAQGIQDWARQVRYRWFEERAADDAWIVLAHHADDLAETVLMRIARGAGLGGLPSMHLLKDNLWRPLLGLSRSDIQILASRQKIVHREDSSNAKMDYSRNRVRHLILPELEKLYPGVRKNLCALAEASQQWIDLLRQPEQDLGASESAAAWKALQRAPGCQRILDRIHEEWGSAVAVTRSFLEQVYQALCDEQAGVFQIDAAHEIQTDRGRLVLRIVDQPLSARWKQYRRSLVGSVLPTRLGGHSQWKDGKQRGKQPEGTGNKAKVFRDESPLKKS